VTSEQNSPRSMTGFAQAESRHENWSLRIALRSVNHRFLDLRMHLPAGFESLEPLLRRILRERLLRGHVELTLHCDAPPGAIGVNRKLAAAYLDELEALRRQFQIQASSNLVELLRLPGVLSPVAIPMGENDGFEESVSRCLNQAIDRLNQMREAEGRTLATEMRNHLAHVSALAGQIGVLARRALPMIVQRLESRLKELIEAAGLDPVRLAQEAAIAADRGDTSEELARLRSHVMQFGAILDSPTEVGKKLDFLLQEMQRETNTLLSKSPGTEAEGLEMTQLGLDMKTEIEKLREQVQNLE
jgi:uncharacterized protein (TIGR00255 family)